jgi:hypothetical protein
MWHIPSTPQVASNWPLGSHFILDKAPYKRIKFLLVLSHAYRLNIHWTEAGADKIDNGKIPVPARDSETQVIVPTTTHFTDWAPPVYLITYI